MSQPQHLTQTHCKTTSTGYKHGKWTGWWNNPDKCDFIRITNRRKKKIVTNYSINEHQLKKVKGAKYLGVTIDRVLSWNDHVNNVTKKANTTRAFLQCNINRCPEAIKTLRYQTFVRPILEYASTVWDPSTEKNIRSVENVQRQAESMKSNYRRPSRLCDHHDRKPELCDPCEQVGGSQACNLVPYRKQPCGRNNILTHSRSYTH